MIREPILVGIIHNYCRPESPGDGIFDDIKVGNSYYSKVEYFRPLLTLIFLALLATMDNNYNLGSDLDIVNISLTCAQLSYWLFRSWWIT